MNLNSSLKKTPIAVIGLSSIFADARNIEEYWNNIITGKDSIKEVPNNRWPIEDYYDEDMFAPDKTYCKVGGFMPELDFNPMEFGLPPNILEVTDASQLLGLIAARDAFKDAGYGPKNERFTAALKEKTGVLLGVGGGQKLITPLIARLQYPIWERALRASGISEEDIPRIVDKMKKAYVGWNENAFPGLLGNVISGRITNRFDLGGINSVVDAACAASLSAMKMALSELVEGRCDMMLTGGVDTDNSPFMYMSFSKTPAFSKSGKISPFSDAADGMLIGEGIGMLVLKRLRDAQRDGDRIYSVIKGVGSSSDGRFKSVYAPRPSGQALAMRRAYEDAGYAPSTVGLLEAHGTGTGAGDPTEFTSMQMVFGDNNPERQHIALGSVKSQIGHTKAAAGAAGMVKAVLALHHKVLPPTINVEQPNSKFDIENSAIYINTEARPWLKGKHPRRTGCSAFGFGGINVHITMEEYEADKALDYRLHQPYKTIVLQAASHAGLQLECQSILDELKGENSEATFNNLITTSQNISLLKENARVGFVTTDITDCTSLLETTIQTLQKDATDWNHPKGIYYRPNGLDQKDHKVVALFAGQGSQYVGMGKETANAFPIIAETFEKADALFAKHNEAPLSNKIFPIPSFSAEAKKEKLKELTKTQYAQPAIGALSAGQYKVFQKAGFRPDFTAGHSFGELTALWAAGVYDEDTFLALAATRGAAMATTNPGADSGTMLAVKASLEKVKPAIASMPSVRIANVNSNNQVVLGGSTQAIRQAEEQLKVQGFSVVPLPVSAAFHTDFVKHAQTPFSAFINRQTFSRPEIPVYANTTGQAYSKNLITVKELLREQILNPVLFKDQIENMHRAGGRIFVEFGPKGVLTNLVKNILKDKEHVALAVNASAKQDSDLQIRQAAVQLQVLGIQLSNIDPYKRNLPALPPRTKMNVMLSGNNYVSAPTAKAYQDVLNDGFQVSGGQTKIIEKVIEKIVEVEVVQEADSSVAVSNNFISSTENEEEMMNKEILQLLKTTIDSFKANQNKSLEIFERFMSDQNQQAQQLLQILSQQIAANQNGSNTSTGTNENGSSSFSNNIPPIVPERPLYQNGNNGSNTNGSSAVVAPVTKAAPTAQPVAAPVTSGINNSQLEKLLLEVVSKKTGYPAEMLELGMDMEADLGIDSIKRVEIFGALTNKYPEMSGINPNELTELRTLGEIVSYVSGKATVTNGTATATTVVNKAPEVVAIAPEAVDTAPGVVATAPAVVDTAPAVSTTNGASVDNGQLEKLLLEVVSEKTGYPAEMLELGMDMEADLGIDSIKRVEIFGALTNKYPSMSGINPNELTELRTLGEIVSYVSGKGGAAVSTAGAEAVSTAGAVDTTVGMDSSELEGLLLEVVSEKTGYPAEMLELGMDMEADLGIDSIKRVEIFGALTNKYPSMSGINPNELTELRTLGEIVSYVTDHGKKKLLA